MKPGYLKFLQKLPNSLTSSDGKKIAVWELTVPSGGSVLSDWANRFRQQYCLDSEIDLLRDGTGLTRAEYLAKLVFPSSTEAPGPSVRAGDFAELLVADYIEYVRGYWVPRGRYAAKDVPNESAKGVDVLGFKVEDTGMPKPTDTLLVFEVKAQFSGKKYRDRLQTAIDDSAKDYLRSAYTLNATKRRLIRSGKSGDALIVQRFQNITDTPYKYISGAAAVLTDTVCDSNAIQGSSAANHNNSSNLELLVIRGADLMKFVDALYKRAANEA